MPSLGQRPVYKFDPMNGGRFIMYEERTNGVELFPPGVYVIGATNEGVYVQPARMEFDAIVDLPNPARQAVIADIVRFLDPETKARYKQWEYIYKRGILMYGPPGTGKTATIASICKYAQDNEMYVFYNSDPSLVRHMLSAMQDNRSRPTIVIWEEFDETVNEDERQVLQLLDGLDSHENVYYLTTTNFIDRIPDRIKHRPSRIAKVIEMTNPSLEARQMYLNVKFGSKGVPADELEYLAIATEGLVIDQLKDAALSVWCLEEPMDEVVERLKKAQASEVTSSQD